MIFDGDLPQKDTLARSYGTFVLCKGVYNARRIVKTRWDKEKSTLTVFIDLRREKVRLKRPAQFSFSVQIDDTAKVCMLGIAKDGIKVTYTPRCPFKELGWPNTYCCMPTLTVPKGSVKYYYGVCQTNTTKKCPGKPHFYYS